MAAIFLSYFNLSILSIDVKVSCFYWLTYVCRYLILQFKTCRNLSFCQLSSKIETSVNIDKPDIRDFVCKISLTTREPQSSGMICGGIGDQIKLRQLHILRYSYLPRAVPLVDHIARRVTNCKQINFTIPRGSLTCHLIQYFIQFEIRVKWLFKCTRLSETRMRKNEISISTTSTWSWKNDRDKSYKI